MDLNRFIIFVVVSVVVGIFKKALKFSLKILIIGLLVAAVVIYRETIFDFIKGLIESKSIISASL